MKRFNTTGKCIADRHYMVPIDRQVEAAAQLIYDYTSGYPFLVSHLCQIIDEKRMTWDKEGVLAAVNHVQLCLRQQRCRCCLVQDIRDMVVQLLCKRGTLINLTTGYMVSFCFNKGKQPGLREVSVGDRIICEAIV